MLRCDAGISVTMTKWPLQIVLRLSSEMSIDINMQIDTQY